MINAIFGKKIGMTQIFLENEPSFRYRYPG